MLRHDIIVIGASAGGVAALSEVVKDLPADLDASVFVVLHLPPWHKSHLPEILSRQGPLPAVHPQMKQSVERGHIYVAPPNAHLLVQNGSVELWHGPRENRNRPSVNTLFRAAAVSHRERVVGVILSGNLDDGSAGLWWIKRFGGVTVVQNPESAEHPEMPRTAMEYVAIDYVVDLPDMAPLLVGLVNGKLQPAPARAKDQPLWEPNN
jgi:two-component system chemotaxis response regulator CheB